MVTHAPAGGRDGSAADEASHTDPSNVNVCSSAEAPTPQVFGVHPFAGVSPADFPVAAWGTERIARWYIGRGLVVFPCCAPSGDGCTGAGLDAHAVEHKRGKLPVRRWGGAGKLVAPSEGDIVGAWRKRAHNVALPCGRNGGAYTIALDFDGPEGERTRELCERVLGALPPTLTSTTGRGRHMVFAAPSTATVADALTIKGSIASVRLDEAHGRLVALAQGEAAASAFDVRCDGGYIIAPGSRHASGAEYTATGAPIAELPSRWWRALPRREVKPPPRAATRPGLVRVFPSSPGARVPDAKRYRGAFDAALPEALRAIETAPDGAQNNTINGEAVRVFRLALGAGVDLEAVASELLAACERGGHPESSARATVDSARGHAESVGPLPLQDRPRTREGGASPPSRPPPPTDDAPDGDDGDARQPDDGRPLVVMSPRVDLAATEAIAGLARDPAVYQRRAMGLVRVVTAPARPAGDAERGPDPGAPIVESLPKASVLDALSRAVCFVARNRKGELRQVQPPDPVVAIVHAQGTYDGVRDLRGIVESPTLRPDGSIITAAGYDPATGLYLHWNGPPIEVPEAPTRDDARAAYQRLSKLFAEFKFQGDEARQRHSRAGIVAAILTPLARAGVAGPVPVFNFEADGQNAGKSIAATTCGALVVGRVPALRQYTPDDDETAKRLASIALAGHAVAIFDNIRSHIEGGALEGVLTARDTIAGRVLGHTADRELPWRTTLYFTANGATYNADNARRVIHIAMKGKPVDLDAPEYDVPDIVSHVIARRRELLTDALTILRAHRLAGSPRPGGVLPSFEAWSRVVSAAVCWCGDGGDPVHARPPESANRDTAHGRAVALAWAAAFGTTPRTIAQVRKACAPPDAGRVGADGPAKAEAREALGAALAELAGAPDLSRASPGSLGKRFAATVVDRVYSGNGLQVCIAPAGEFHGVARYAARVEHLGNPAHPTTHDPSDDSPDGGGWGDTGFQGHSRTGSRDVSDVPGASAVLETTTESFDA